MTKALLKVLLVVSFTAVTVAGCTFDLPFGLSVSPNDLILKIRPDRDTIQSGDTIKLKIKLQNASKHTGSVTALAIHPDSLEIECMSASGANLCMNLPPDPQPKKIDIKPGKASFYQVDLNPKIAEGEEVMIRAIYQNNVKSNPAYVKVPPPKQERPDYDSGYGYYDSGDYYDDDGGHGDWGDD